MAYAHSFAADFYGNPDSAKASKRPTTVCDALASMSKRRWNALAREVFGCKPDYLSIETVLVKIMETDTVSSFCTPVSVWIDEEGYHTIDVYD